MDEDIRTALSELKLDLKDGFKEVNKRFDEMVTRREFEAEVRRVDQAHKTLRAEFDQHITSSEGIISGVRKDVEKATEDNRKEFDTEFERFKAATRWFIGLAISISSVLSGVIFAILQAIGL